MKIFALIAILVGISQSFAVQAADAKTIYYSGEYVELYDLVATLQQEDNLPRNLVVVFCKGLEPGSSATFVQDSIDPITRKVVFVSRTSPKQSLELTFNKDWSKLEGTVYLGDSAQGTKIQFWRDNKVEQLGCGA